MNLSSVMQMMQRPSSIEDDIIENEVLEGLQKNPNSFGSYNESSLYNMNQSAPYDINSSRFPQNNLNLRDSQILATQQQNNMTLPSIEVVLFHKPKGSKGLWKPVEVGDKLRVTKGNGKRLKLQVTATCDFDRESLVVRLMDLDLRTSFSPNKDTGSFVIETAKCHERTIEIGIKIFRMGGRLQFLAQLQTKDFGSLQGYCHEFISYSSGSVREKPSKAANISNQSATPVSNPSSQFPPVNQNTQSLLPSSNPGNILVNQIAPPSYLPSHQSTLPNPNPFQMGMAINPLALRSSLNNNQNPPPIPPQNAAAYSNRPRLPPHLQSQIPQHLQSQMSTGEPILYPQEEIKTEPGLEQQLDTKHLIAGNLEVKGVVRAKAFMQFSDIRLKTNITDIVDAVQIVTALQGKRYEWKDDPEASTTGAKKVIGLIAQEVQRVIPEVVREDSETGLLSVSYTEILPILVEAFKDFFVRYQQDKEQLQLTVSDLQMKLDTMSTDLEKANHSHIEVHQLFEQNKNHETSDSHSTDSKSQGDSISTKNTKSKRHQAKAHPCRIFQFVFAAFLALFVICSICGIVVGISNSDDGDFFRKNKSVPPPPSDQYNESSQAFSSGNASEESHRLVGLSLFEAGLFGAFICGIGLVVTTLFIYLSDRRTCKHCRKLMGPMLSFSRLRDKGDVELKEKKKKKSEHSESV